MGHDHYFLTRLDRVDQECEQLALLFYRQPDLLRLVLSSVEIPDRVEQACPRPNEACSCGSNKKYKKCCGAFVRPELAKGSVE